MLHRVVMKIIHVTPVIRVIPYRVLPMPPLPDPPFTFVHAALGTAFGFGFWREKAALICRQRVE